MRNFSRWRIAHGSLIANAVLFQLLWFIAVQAHELLAVTATAIYLLVHTKIVINTRRQWLFIIGVGSVGWMMESLIGSFGVIDFHGAYYVSAGKSQVQLAPIWMLCLWLGFATTLLSSLYGLATYPLQAAVLGAIAGPLSYWGGAALSGSVFQLPTAQVLAFEACLWALLLPSLLHIARIVMQHQRTDSNYGQ